MYLKDITKNNVKKALNEVGKLERKQMHLHTQFIILLLKALKGHLELQ